MATKTANTGQEAVLFPDLLKVNRMLVIMISETSYGFTGTVRK